MIECLLSSAHDMLGTVEAPDAHSPLKKKISTIPNLQFAEGEIRLRRRATGQIPSSPI